ncbi:hypothetical protein [Chroococcus sp. FPU101]|uniref:hypothetical protein n=1 Tax=Chroococcus sp. FPU101 TaxID=1974212 RepID=UPI001A8DFD59|nr:hypothetical protein [Chroococcus sp. FPU101]GFE68205.1 hypothetical protein CFPU101_08150 [Chroococcus sp. FPU101]
MVNIPYHMARLRGRVSRTLYQAGLAQIVRVPLPPSQEISVNVFALSCERDLPEQVASIRSFIRYVGVPDQFTVISDGSYTEQSCHLLSQIHPCVKVVPIHQLVKPDLPQAVYEYAANNPMGKKLAVLLSIPIQKTTIYTDSDILFFPGAVDLVRIINSEETFSRYLPDCATKMDERVIYNDSEKLNPVNGGFIIFKEKPDWQFAMKRFLKLKELTHYFTEQTLVHLTMHHNHSQPLCTKRYVLSVDDQFIYPDQFAESNLVLRHYVSDIRHKFWFHLSI